MISGSSGVAARVFARPTRRRWTEIGPLVARFPVLNDDQIMLVSDGGQVIRVPVASIRIASRATKGVTIFKTADGEKVVSVERISEPQGDDAPSEAGGTETLPAGVAEGSQPE